MKILAYIISFTVIFLSVKPGIDALAYSFENEIAFCTNTMCVADTDTDGAGAEDRQSQEDNGMCNPFQICSACVMLYVATPINETTPQPEPRAKQAYGYQTNIASQFIADFWQPPKIG
jgi:hypothetical protein